MRTVDRRPARTQTVREGVGRRKGRPRHLPPPCERLEDRLMPSADSDVISVGRTLSSWTSADARNAQLKNQYTVYDQQAEAVSGVQLSRTLKSGVSCASATMAPSTRTGQALSWSLGTIARFGSATVDVADALAGSNVLQIDSESHVVGVCQGASTAENDPDLLAETPTQLLDPAQYRHRLPERRPELRLRDDWCIVRRADVDLLRGPRRLASNSRPRRP